MKTCCWILLLALAAAAPLERAAPAAPLPPVRASGGPLMFATPAASEPPPAEREANKPVYRRTWFWVAAGVVLATGLGVGFYYWQRPATDPYQVAGTLGTLGR